MSTAPATSGCSDAMLRAGPCFSSAISLVAMLRDDSQRTEVAKLSSNVFRPRPPVFVMEVAEVSRACFLLIEIAQCDVQPHLTIPVFGRVIKVSRFDLETRVKGDRPLDDVPFAFRLTLCHALLCASPDPVLVGIPGRFAPTWLAFQKAAHSDSSQTTFREVAYHLPGFAVPRRAFLAFPLFGGIDQDFHLVAEPGVALRRKLVCFGVVIGKPPRRIYAVKDIVCDV